MDGKNRMRASGGFLWRCLKWMVLGCLMGLLGGLLGAGFHHLLHGVTQLRAEHPWLVWLLPVGGLGTVGLYRLLKLQGNRGTNEVIEAILDGKHVRGLVAPAIVAAASLTHLFGGSAGREGAALQLGGSVASLLGRKLGLGTGEQKVLVTAGMSAVFAGLFATPLTAALFCMEFTLVGVLFSPALLPCVLSAYVASRVSGAFGVHVEGAVIETVALTLGDSWRYLVLAVLVSVLGIAMYTLFHKAEHGVAKALPNPYLRIAVGGRAEWYAFAGKLLFTAITLAAGFKGGEIVPTFCIGATFGCVAGGLLGLDPGICGALGLVGLFCCATNSPIASMVLSVELFGSGNLHLFALMCVLCFVLSGPGGLYGSQRRQFGLTVEKD